MLTFVIRMPDAKNNPGTPLPISLWWLECVDDELSALAVPLSGIHRVHFGENGPHKGGALYKLNNQREGVEHYLSLACTMIRPGSLPSHLAACTEAMTQVVHIC
jgi:hypothetical protein